MGCWQSRVARPSEFYVMLHHNSNNRLRILPLLQGFTNFALVASVSNVRCNFFVFRCVPLDVVPDPFRIRSEPVKRRNVILPIALLSVVATACNSIDRIRENSEPDLSAVAAPGLQDGQLAVPADYRSWPVFLTDIQKTEARQIRDIYINTVGHAANRGDAFPAGTISVMEIWKPVMNDDGTPEMNADGKMIKDELSLVFLMGKSEGAGELVDPALRNGDWVYAGYQADGVTPGGPDASACRGCHLPEADNDWVFRYDEYFASR